MENEFISYEQSLILKELGFNEPCLAGYIKFRGSGTFELAFYKDRNVDFNTTSNIYVSAPIKQQAFRWFREKYNLLGIVGYCDDNSGKFMSVIDKINSDIDYDMNAKDTYEEAELACLDRLIEIVKNK